MPLSRYSRKTTPECMPMRIGTSRLIAPHVLNANVRPRRAGSGPRRGEYVKRDKDQGEMAEGAGPLRRPRPEAARASVVVRVPIPVVEEHRDPRVQDDLEGIVVAVLLRVEDSPPSVERMRDLRAEDAAGRGITV